MSTGASSSVFDGDGVLANVVEQLFVQMILILSFTRICSIGLRFFGEPDVMAEVIGGIILGPTVLGNIPGFTSTIFPPTSVSNTLTGIANLGLVLFLFSVGCDIDFDHFKELGIKSVIVSLGSLVLPLALGFAVAVPIWNTLMVGSQTTSFGVFGFFVAVALSISALPVLARLLGEMKMNKTSVGVAALGAAVIDDMIAWCLLAVVVALTTSTGNPINALYTFLSCCGWVLALLFGLRPLFRMFLQWYHDKGHKLGDWTVWSLCKRKSTVEEEKDGIEEVVHVWNQTDRDHMGSSWVNLTTLSIACIFAITSGWVTEFLGADSIFGAFWCGLAMPRSHDFAREVAGKLRDPLIVVFLPVYFTLSGLNTNITSLNTWTSWGIVLLLIVAATVGKFVGATFSCRVQKIPWRECCTIGVLLNTKGLVELVVLNVGYANGTINQPTFAAMVVMAIVTTLMTAPIVSAIYPRKYWKGRENTLELKVVENGGGEMGGEKVV